MPELNIHNADCLAVNVIYNENCLKGLKKLPDNSINCCVTSPPYYGLRDYGNDEQIGLENTPQEYIDKLTEVFEEVRRVLRKDGTLWLNIGDSYAGSGFGDFNSENFYLQTTSKGTIDARLKLREHKKNLTGFKPKDLIGIPWMLAFALRNSGWYLRQDIIWAKKNSMPESVKDRCTKNHEYIFLLSKSYNYFYDHEAIQEQAVWDLDGTGTLKRKKRVKDNQKSNPSDQKNGIRKIYTNGKNDSTFKEVKGTKNKRSVWNYPTSQFPQAHFATFPETLIVDCIKAGCPEEGIVIDPFMGAGTTALVARKLNRKYIGFEINEEYKELAENRIQNELGLFT